MAKKKAKQPKEKIYRAGLEDPRTGINRVLDLANRALTGNAKSPARNWDDTPAQQRKARKRK